MQSEHSSSPWQQVSPQTSVLPQQKLLTQIPAPPLHGQPLGTVPPPPMQAPGGGQVDVVVVVVEVVVVVVVEVVVVVGQLVSLPRQSPLQQTPCAKPKSGSKQVVSSRLESATQTPSPHCWQGPQHPKSQAMRSLAQQSPFPAHV
ncbi:MAG: hypothetical protein AB7G88_04040 [Thermomicrobiales bacterium]